MVSVTWGSNTVHTYGASPAPSTSFGGTAAGSPGAASAFNFGGSTAPASSSFGSPAPAPAGLFGSTAPAPAPLFGATPSTGGIFGGSAPAPGGLFGTAPAPGGGGLFGSSATSRPGGLFGSPAPSPAGGLFGSTAPAPSAFGFPPPPAAAAPPAAPQIPAQAALQAHLDASARQEEAKVTAAMEKVYKAYTGTDVVPPDARESSPFCSVLYNPATPEVRQMLWLSGMGADGRARPVVPDRPPQISDRDWNGAVVRNPDWQQYMPVALVGAEALRARLTYHQEHAAVAAEQVKQIRETQAVVRRRWEDVRRNFDDSRRNHERQRKQLIDVMQKVELARSFNLPLQVDEVEALKRVSLMLGQTVKLRDALAGLADLQARTQPSRPIQAVDVPDEKRLVQLLKDHRKGLADLTSTVQRDMKDLKLIKQRVEGTGPVKR